MLLVNVMPILLSNRIDLAGQFLTQVANKLAIAVSFCLVLVFHKQFDHVGQQKSPLLSAHWIFEELIVVQVLAEFPYALIVDRRRTKANDAAQIVPGTFVLRIGSDSLLDIVQFTFDDLVLETSGVSNNEVALIPSRIVPNVIAEQSIDVIQFIGPERIGFQ